jgi:multimeric flavodoxin WrbA
MDKIYWAVQDANVLAFGSPIYMGAESGWMKGTIDRVFASLAMNPNGPGYQTSSLPESRR